MSNSIKNILMNNRLVKGRLSLSIIDIKKIFKSNKKLNEQIKVALDKENKAISSALFRIKKLKVKLRNIEETHQKAFKPSISNISLLYKNVGKNKYVKARFYWCGKQREVQIGSFNNIISIINEMVNAGYLNNISIKNSDKMTWEKFNKNSELVMATKEIAALKFQEYVLRMVFNESEENNAIEHISNKQTVIKSSEHKKIFNVNDEKYDWYEKWREQNL